MLSEFARSFSLCLSALITFNAAETFCGLLSVAISVGFALLSSYLSTELIVRNLTKWPDLRLCQKKFSADNKFSRF